MLRLPLSRSKTAPLPDASIPRLRSPQPLAHADPCCTACPSHPPESVTKMESAFGLQENPSDSLFEELALGMPAARLVEVNRILLLPNRPVAGGFHQGVERPGSGRATIRDAGGTVLKTPPLSRNRPGSQSVRSARRWFRAGTPLPPSGVRSHNDAW